MINLIAEAPQIYLSPLHVSDQLHPSAVHVGLACAPDLARCVLVSLGAVVLALPALHVKFPYSAQQGGVKEKGRVKKKKGSSFLLPLPLVQQTLSQ